MQQRDARAEVAGGELAAVLTLFVAHTDEGVFVLKRGDLISEMASREGKWDVHVLKAAGQAARVRHGTAVDVGAHFGLISVPLARRFDRVLSFEPNGFNASLLRANAALNSRANIECYEEALFSHATRVSLAPDDKQEIPVPLTPEGALNIRAAVNLGAYSFHPGGAGLYPRDARTLDSFCLEDLAFLKVDTQGADGEVLMGAMQTIARCRPWVLFEWEEHLSAGFSVGFAEVAARFADLGYDLRVLWRHNEKQIDYLATPAGAQPGEPE
jgi:FkbM family methyltransferase